MTLDTIPIVVALVLGPTIAVLAAMGVLYWERSYQRRLDVFRTMMRMRRHWLSQEWIGSLNLIPVEFSRYPAVIEAFDTLMARYGDTAWKGADDVRRRIVLDAESAACELLQRMADALKVELRGPDLRTRPNTPYGWSTDEVQSRQHRELIMQVLQGSRTLKVELAANPLRMPLDR
ncbi:MAG: DUF6680 family protein [Terricaulis sp.]